MSPEANVKEKPLTVTMAPPPAALAADKKKLGPKRSEAENLIDGHAATIKGNRLTTAEEAALLRKQGRTGAAVGFALLGFGAVMIIGKYGALFPTQRVFIFGAHEGVTVKATVAEAYENLKNFPFFFGLTTKMIQFRLFVSLSAFFFAALVAFPGLFGKYWMKLGLALGYVMTRVILGIMFYAVFTPFSLFLKLIGRDPLRLARHEGSYWVLRDHQRAANHFEHLS